MFSRHLVKMTIAVAALALLGSGAQAQVRGRMGSLLGGFIPNTPIGVANSFLNGNFNTGFIPNTPAGVANNYLNGNRNMQGSYINPQGFVPNAPVGVQNSYLYGNPYASFSPQAGTYYPINGSVDFNANTPFIPNTPTGVMNNFAPMNNDAANNFFGFTNGGTSTTSSGVTNMGANGLGIIGAGSGYGGYRGSGYDTYGGSNYGGGIYPPGYGDNGYGGIYPPGSTDNGYPAGGAYGSGQPAVMALPPGLLEARRVPGNAIHVAVNGDTSQVAAVRYMLLDRNRRVLRSMTLSGTGTEVTFRPTPGATTVSATMQYFNGTTATGVTPISSYR